MATTTSATPPPIVLVPGYWLGAWVWDAVVARLAERGLDATALTLPGLAPGATRAGVRFADHVAHVAEHVPPGRGTVLVAHSGAGAVATAVADRAPDALARVVYVDSGPVADGHVPDADLPADQVDVPFPGLEALGEQGASPEGLTAADRSRLETLAVPHPAGAVRDRVALHDARRDAVPTTLVCCSIPSATVRELAGSGEGMFAPVAALTDLTLVDLPTGHWPMLSRPVDLADLIAAEATRGS
ncbi:alpha/beta hydrolase [Cellulomonas sp. DKR-3]|uniref:Alpha/beta hydrolase n=1 Tax=Cellulomonas fulva TaxID=2835530 RepID=A0ABS5U2K1_9CELL|nr:alpha/beta hydrolase [Cellulomonas fulva]MBT0995623.1 alpha/beta hydrolase [Cellulomonas fulva]